MKLITTTLIVFFSLLQLYATAQVNLITNPGFETDYTANWEVTSKNTGFIPSSIAHISNGTNALQMVLPDDNPSLPNAQLRSIGYAPFATPLTKATTFTISIDAYADTEMAVRFMLQSEKAGIKELSSNLSVTTDNQTLTTTITLTPTEALPSLSDWQILLQMGGNTGTLVVDNISLVQQAEKTDEELAQEALDAIAINFNSIDPQDGNGILYSITLPTDGENASTINWASSNENSIATDGTVIRGAAAEEVTMTASVTIGGATLTKDFVVNVLPFTVEDGNMIVSNANFNDGLTAWSSAFNTSQVNEGDFTFTSITHKENGSLAAQFDITNGGTTFANLVTRTVYYPFNETTSTPLYFEITSDIYASEETKLRYQFSGKDIENGNQNINTDFFFAGEDVVTVSKIIEAPTNLVSWRLLLQVGGNTGQIVYDNVIVKEIATNVGQVTLTKEALKLVLAEGDETDNVTQNFTVDITDANNYGTTITWETDNAVISFDGANATVSPSSTDQIAKLKATIEKEGFTEVRNFTVTVLATDEQKLIDATAAVEIEFAEGDTEAMVTTNVTLPLESLFETTVTWQSENANISTEGVVTLISEEVSGKLTATVTLGDLSETKEFTLTTDRNATAKVEEAKVAVAIIFTENDDSDNVTQNLELPTTGLNNTTITWEANNVAISSDGTVTRTSSDQEVELIATISLEEVSTTSTFTVTVLGDDAIALTEAKDALEIIYVEGESASNVVSDVTLPATGLHAAVVTWTSNNETVVSAAGSVTRQQSSTDVVVEATLVIGDLSVTKSFTLTVVSNEQELVNEAKDALEITYAEGDNASFVTQNITLVTTADNNTTVTWSSDNETIITNVGEVTIPLSDTEVVLTATLILGESTGTKEFTVVVSGNSSILLEEAKSALEIAYADGEDATTVTQNITLVAEGENDAVVTWSSSIEDVITTSGEVSRMLSDTEVVLTATLTLGESTTTKEFTVTVLGDDAIALTEAKDALEIIYVEGESASNVVSDVTLPATGLHTAVVTWISNNETVVSATGSVTRQQSSTDVVVEATLVIGDLSVTKSFTLTVVSNEQELVNEAKDALEITYAEGDNASSVTQNITLVTTADNNTTVTWSSDNETIITNFGEVTIPLSDTEVVLTATLILGESTGTKEFTVVVSGNSSVLLEEAKNALEIAYADGEDATTVTQNITLVAEGENDAVVTWSSSNEDVITTSGVVTQSFTDQVIDLTATLLLGDETTTKVFSVTVVKTEAPTAVEKDKVTVKVWPNPSQNKINITSVTPIKTLQIYNLTGQLVYELPTPAIGNTTQVDISGLTNGNYILRVNGGHKTFIKQ
ncbi:T9SS type A sorting domain-containing protein [Flammeovirga pectinis]|uniref:T9SS type A sorting domain-containing protein n=1 Tax=Flammeovirga pectinis TaxID=2494373 RepID=A0A3Q9FUG2_9BACT|nr:T9SS type A sorting domain-containing protein [Flammeovirga pectinis]AZQ64837.1 T9SS type A sorting domain-containing protein [Flammeovirga pectinis]